MRLKWRSKCGLQAPGITDGTTAHNSDDAHETVSNLHHFRFRCRSKRPDRCELNPFRQTSAARCLTSDTDEGPFVDSSAAVISPRDHLVEAKMFVVATSVFGPVLVLQKK